MPYCWWGFDCCVVVVGFDRTFLFFYPDCQMTLPDQHLMIGGVAVNTKAVFTPQLWDRNGSGTQPGARVHTCSTGSGRSGTSRPPRDVIAVERFRNGSGWLCGVNAQPDAFRSRLVSTCVIMKNMK